jgi:cellulose synthase/poly-beta-1,6-N-acetylglucosamine synthase-like glycosyltransferase
VIAHRQWLRDLARPFADPRVGATTGIRWFRPEDSAWGTLVRYVWNAGACSQMMAFRIPWGGSLAFRAQLFRDTDLLERWRHCFCEDTVSYAFLRQRGMDVCFVPDATMVNPERIALPDCFRFIRRQMLTVRLHHPSWQRVRAMGIGASLTVALLFALLVGGAVTGQLFVAGAVLGAMATYMLALGLTLWWIDRALGKLSQQDGEPTPTRWWKLALAGPLTQAVYLAALVSVSFLRSVEWRGVTYELGGAAPVRLVAYRPYQPLAGSTDRTASVV